MTRAVIGLGSNLGDRVAHLRRAVASLDAHPGIAVRAVSPVYENPALTPDDAPQPDFLNAAALVETTLAPEALLDVLLGIEAAAGRERRARWSARPLDLDVLLFGDEPVATDRLAVPHPRLAERRFVLQPMADLVPDAVVPGPGRTVAALLDACPDPHPLTPTPHRLMPDAPTDSAAWPDALRYVAVEGVIGAGKTSLARLLARHLGARLVLEEFEENPFLPDFYRDPARWAFQTQLAFLASRFRQQKNLLERDLFHQRTLSDYTFDKDRIFARLTLSGDEMALYETLHALMEPSTATPDLTVYLSSSVDRLVHNIEQRGREYEKSIERTYLADLAEAYEHHFRHYSKGPLLIVNTTDIDFVNNADDFDRLVARIAAMAGQRGTAVFNPPASVELDLR